uniref:Putative secreted protein n=1 Tax=Ixodes ricinus TaxID=34613 RepID=A0A6B0UFG7_IXORI
MTRRQCASGRRPRSSAMWHITASLSGRASWSSAGACCPPRRTATTTLPPQSSIQIENSILLNFHPHLPLTRSGPAEHRRPSWPTTRPRPITTLPTRPSCSPP